MGQLSEKAELHLLRQEVARLKAQPIEGSEHENSESMEDEIIEDLPANGHNNDNRHRSGVSAEAYGK